MSVEENLYKSQTEGLCPNSRWLDKESLRVPEQSGQKLAEIEEYVKHLEQQKEEIEQQLTGLEGEGSLTYLEKLLHELKEQELKNEHLLCQLSTQITYLCGKKERDDPSDLVEDKKMQHISFDLMSSVNDGLLSSQIRSLRLAYMQAGGADPEVLAHMHDLQAEAYILEQVRSRAQHKSGKKRREAHHWTMESDIWAVEQENWKLEEELQRMQLARERHKGDEAGSEHRVFQKHYMDEIASLQAEVFSLRKEVKRGREKQALPLPPAFSGCQLAQINPVDYIFKQHSLVDKQTLDPVGVLGSAPYDSTAGFIIFYDIVLGVDASFITLRLVASLYFGGREMGRPIPMPPVQCQPAGALASPLCKRTGNYALLAVKQPVPRMQPSPALSLVVEVQALGDLDSYSEESQGFVPRGWARLLLFDQHNQVQSGFWRVPFRSLPVRPSLSTGQLNSVPQLGDMEICLRVVSAQDGAVQCLAKIDSCNISHYKHPPVISHSATVLADQTQHLTTLQFPSSPFFSAQPQTDCVKSSSIEDGQRQD